MPRCASALASVPLVAATPCHSALLEAASSQYATPRRTGALVSTPLCLLYCCCLRQLCRARSVLPESTRERRWPRAWSRPCLWHQPRELAARSQRRGWSQCWLRSMLRHTQQASLFYNCQEKTCNKRYQCRFRHLAMSSNLFEM